VTGGGVYVILDGEAHVVIDGTERARLTRGDFFGEISLLTDTQPTADVIAATVLRCLIIPDTEVKAFLLKQPTVMYRMLQVEARRAVRAGHAGVRVVRPQQSRRGRAGAPGAHPPLHGPRVRRARAARDGGRDRRVRRARGGALRVRMALDGQGRDRLHARHLG